MAKLDPRPYPMPPLGFGVNDPHIQAYDNLVAASNALPEDEYVGALISWQIADGYASYLVTSMSPVTLQWVPLADGYRVDDALIRGLRKPDVIAKVESTRAFNRLFGRR